MRLPSLWRSHRTGSLRLRQARSAQGSFRPHVEEMEPRALPSTLGVYELLTSNQDISRDRNLNNPYVDGFALRYTWNFLEPVRGQYNWSFVDRQINSIPAGKSFSLSVTAGFGTDHDGTFNVGTPAWVYQAGARPFTFTDPKTGSPAQIPLPWDPVFQSVWTDFIGALGAHYSNNPRPSHVKITGVNTDTAETTLPPPPASDLKEWGEVGYTRAGMETAWEGIANAFHTAFPNQPIAFIANPGGFPTLDSQGNVIGHDSKIIDDLINYGAQTYHSNFIVQNNGLSDFWVYSKVATAPAGVIRGYQMLWFVTNDTTDKMNNGTPINPATELQNAVNLGVQNGAQFLEIYQDDIHNPALQGVVASAQAQLHGSAGSAGGSSGPGSSQVGVSPTHTQGAIAARALGVELYGQSRRDAARTDAGHGPLRAAAPLPDFDGDADMIAALAGVGIG